MRSYALTKRLALTASLVLLIALSLVGLALNAANHRGAVSALQVRMEAYVYQVLAAMEVGPAGQLLIDADFADPRLSQPGSGIYVLVSGQQETWRSRSALGQQLPQPLSLDPGEVSFAEPDGRDIHYVFTHGIGWQVEDGSIRPFTVAVLVDRDELERQTSAFRLGLWRALGAAGGILLLAQLVMLYIGFRPLRVVAADVARIESGEAPRLEGHYPAELEPLARNVNRLLDTEKSNQARFRNALDSLAHSLKTPLAVIQAGLSEERGEGAAERGAAMQNAVDEMSRLIATRLERAGGSARRTLAEPVVVEPQLQRIVNSLQKVYSHKMIRPEFRIEDGLRFYGEQRDLLELTGNLLDNSFKYGKARVRVSAGVLDPAKTRPGIWLHVEDDGAGIGESEWADLLQRGSRGDERVEGHGLGLAIVKELVTAYGGEVSIDHSDLGGTLIRVQIPAS